MKIFYTHTESENYFTRTFGDLRANSGDSSQSVPTWGMSLREAGSMRFRWNESNLARDEFFKKLAPALTPVPVQLDHTKIVYDVKSADDVSWKIGDGIITKNKNLIPTVTVADCMPIFLFDPITEVFGIVHSGWKGTGIVGEAIKLAERNYGARAEDFHIVLGPHIHSCCYIVDEDRAKYFEDNFGAGCATKIGEGEKLPSFAWKNGNGPLYRLSLEKANLALLEKLKIPKENIFACDDCTACNPVFGSNRRETASATKSAIPPFTVMAAFVMWGNAAY